MATKKGPLKTKLKPRYLPFFVSDEEQLKIIRSWDREDHDKLLLLCADMGVDDSPSRFYDLALALARRQYAGFQQTAPLSKWTELTRGFLVVEIERLTAGGLDVKAAAGVIARRPEWKTFLSKTRDGGEGLRVQYQKFKEARFAAVMRDAFKTKEIQNTLDEWHENLLEALKNPHPTACL